METVPFDILYYGMNRYCVDKGCSIDCVQYINPKTTFRIVSGINNKRNIYFFSRKVVHVVY